MERHRPSLGDRPQNRDRRRLRARDDHHRDAEVVRGVQFGDVYEYRPSPW